MPEDHFPVELNSSGQEGLHRVPRRQAVLARLTALLMVAFAFCLISSHDLLAMFKLQKEGHELASSSKRNSVRGPEPADSSLCTWEREKQCWGQGKTRDGRGICRRRGDWGGLAVVLLLNETARLESGGILRR